jgi:Fe2+ or Zn2+ uptake regulation protein
MNPSEHTPTRLARLTERYAATGLPLTSQRRTLLEVLAGRRDHPTVDQIYSAVAERLPEVSRTTVYRSLEVLTQLRILKRVEHPGSAVRYDPNMEAHHHFLCSRCGDLADLPLEAVDGHERLRFVGDPSAVAEEVAILVRGTCARCATLSA